MPVAAIFSIKLTVMKQEFRQIFHVKTETGWQAIPFPGPKVKLRPEEAAIRNNQFDENGIRLVPKNEYEKYLANARLLN